MDPNDILQSLAGATALVGLIKLARYRFRIIGWTLVYALLLAVVIMGHNFWRESAGWVSLSLWFPFILVPALGQNLLFRLQLKEQWESAIWVARVLAVLHPFDGWAQQPRQFQIIGRLQRGDTAEAREMLPELERSNPRLAGFVVQHLMRVENRWPELRQWIEMSFVDISRSPGACVLYTRALGETGDVEAMLRHHLIRATKLPPPLRSLSQLFVAAFSGRIDVIDEGLDGPYGQLAEETRQFWRATALQAAGRPDEANSILDDLAQKDGLLIQESARYRLEHPARHYELESASDDELSQLDEFQRQMIGDMRFSSIAGQRRPICTWLFILFNTIVFLYQMQVESRTGISDDYFKNLGALIIPPVGGTIEWWRIWTAGFLHAPGLLHIGFNMGALWYLGRKVEAVWGRLSLAVVYLGATFGANALTLLVKTQGTDEQLVVGASGGVMGVFGALGMFAFMSWHELRADALRRIVMLLSFLLVLQVSFDVWHREFIAWYAHLLGLGVGMVLAVGLRVTGLWDRPTSSPRDTETP